MHIRILAASLAAALTLAGCSAQRLASDINTLTAALTSPQAREAVANARALGQTFACAAAAVDATLVTVNTAVTGAVQANPRLAAAISAKQATAVGVVNGVVEVVYVKNATLCKALGGTPMAAAAGT